MFSKILHFTLSFFILIFTFYILPYSASAAVIGASPSATSGRGLNSGLVGYWTFDGKDMVNGAVLDKSGHFATGTPINIATSTFYAPGKIGQGFRFDGVDDYVGNITFPSISTTQITQTYWIKKTALSGVRRINLTGTFQAGFSDNLFFAHTISSSGTDNNIPYNSISGLTKNAWHFLAITRDVGSDNKVKVYLNGVLKLTGSLINSANGVMTLNSFQIGGSSQPFDGSIDDVRIYNRALSATEVRQLYDIGSATKQSVSPPATSGKGLNRGLVGYWTFDGKDVVSGVAQDKSGNGNNGNLVNIATSTFYAPGKIGQGARFDGVGSYVNTNKTVSSFISNATGSISVWIKPTGPSINCTTSAVCQTIVGDTNFISTINYTSINRGISGGLDRIWINNWDTNQDNVGITYTNNMWTHIVWVHGNGTLFAYKDGVLVNSVASGNTGALTNKLVIGGVGIAASSLYQYFSGTLDDIRIYNRALSATEVRQLYDLGAATKQAVSPPATSGKGLNSGLVGYWTFDGKDVVNGVALDKSGNGNNGNLVNIATSSFYAAGKIGQGFKFDGVNDYVTISNTTANQITGALTMSAWINFSSAQINKGIIGKYITTGNNRGYVMYTANDAVGKKIQCSIQTSGSVFDSGSVTTTSANWNDGKWHHVVCKYNPSTELKIYVDGVAASPNALTIPSSIFLTTTDLEVGSSSNGSFPFSGSIDDVRIYNRALSATEVKQLYNIGR